MTIKYSIHQALAKPMADDGHFTPEMMRLFRDILDNRRLNTGPSQSLTLATDTITIGTNFSFFSVDTEAAAASDNLVTINGSNVGDVIFIKSANSARTVVVKHGTGNIKCVGAVDLSLDNTGDMVMLFYDGTNWRASLWEV